MARVVARIVDEETSGWLSICRIDTGLPIYGRKITLWGYLDFWNDGSVVKEGMVDLGYISKARLAT